MGKSREYVGQFSHPYWIAEIEGVPDTNVYAPGDVLFRDTNGEAFLLPCVTLGDEELADLEYIVVREKATAGGVVVKPNINYRFSRVGGVDWTVPAMNNPFNAPTDMADALGSVNVLTANYEEWRIAGAIAYAVACVPVTDALRRILRSAASETDLYTVPTIGSGTPTFGASGLITTQFHFRQH